MIMRRTAATVPTAVGWLGALATPAGAHTITITLGLGLGLTVAVVIVVLRYFAELQPQPAEACEVQEVTT